MLPDSVWAGTAGSSAPIIGRSAERALLREHLAQAEAGSGQFVILGGEAGIGKTTLARDLAATAAGHGACVLTGHCYDLMATPPYGLWRDLANDYLPDGEMPTLPRIPDGQSLEGVSNQAELFQRVRASLDALIATRLVVVILEDVQWADPASLELLRHIGSHLAGRRLLIVVTYRVDELTRQLSFYQQLPALVRETGGLQINLRRWSMADVDAFLDQSFTLPAAQREQLAAYLDRHAEGNPFFVVELLRGLIDEGRLRWADGSWMLEAADQVVVSALLRQVIERRLTRLGAAAREPLQLAAVIGQDIPLDVWMAASGEDRDALLEIVERAVEAHVFSVPPDGAHIRFVHALTRAAIYDSILPPRRLALHRTVAEALAADDVPAPDAVAYHFTQARDERAPDWLIQAGESAQRAYAWRTAYERFLTAADLLRGQPGAELTRARLLYRCGRLLRYSDAASGIASLHEASRLAEFAGDKVLAADATYSRGLLRCFADDWRLGLREMTAGIEDLEALPPEEGHLSWTLVNWLADALPIIDLPASGDIDPAAQALAAAGVNHRRGGLPWFLSAAGHLTEAGEMGAAFLRHVEGIGSGPLVLSAIGHNLHGLGIMHASLGEVDQARDAFDRARAIYRRLDHHAVIAFTWLVELRDVLIPFLTTDLAARQAAADGAREALEQAGGALLSAVLARRAELALCLLDGRWKQAREIVADFPASGNYVLRREIVSTLAPIAWWQGRPDEAWGYVREWLPSGPATPPGNVVLQDGLLLQRLAAAMSLAAGKFEDARVWLDANGRWLDWSGAVRGRAEYRALRARLELASGSLTQARFHAAEAVTAATEPMQPLALCGAKRVAGIVAMRSGDREAAQRELTAAVELADACGDIAARVQTRTALARFQLETGAAEEARALLGVAAMDAARCGAMPLSRRIEAILAPGGARRGDAQHQMLTAREREVLALVANGLTDAEVAEQLFISPRTVGQHLRSIYGKLEVTSRAGATRYAVQHQLV